MGLCWFEQCHEKKVVFHTLFNHSGVRTFPHESLQTYVTKVLYLLLPSLNSRLKRHILRVYNQITVTEGRSGGILLIAICSLWVSWCLHWHPGAVSSILPVKPFLVASVVGASSILTPICHFPSTSWLPRTGVIYEKSLFCSVCF